MTNAAVVAIGIAATRRDCAAVSKGRLTLRWLERGARRHDADRCEYLGQLGPVARMPALSAQACRTVASATACVEIPTLDVHRLPCDGVASLRPRLQEAVFTLYGATTRS